MKRFAMLFGTLVLTIQITGCGGSGNGAPMTGTAYEDPNRPSEEKEEEAKKKADIAKRIADLEAKNAKKGNR
jgi:hypothetical protein